jgi:excisionase family DNA binding protein
MTPRGQLNASPAASSKGTISRARSGRGVGSETTLTERLLTADDVAALLRVPRSTVYELARTRRIPYLKIGRRTLFEAVSLREWIAARGVPPLR